MLRGHLDSVTQGGFAEGWACDDARPDVALIVCIHREDGAELARGFAWAFRKDLAELGLRHGWCAFRLRLSEGAEALRGTRLILRDCASGAQIHASSTWRIHDGADAACATLPQVAAQDPTVLRSLQQLSGCGALFAGFVARHGTADFVRAAHGYVLDLAPDHAALERHEELLRMGAVTPFGLLIMLANTEEFRARPRLLPSPSSPGFVFYR
jgi:hypothetical protein